MKYTIDLDIDFDTEKLKDQYLNLYSKYIYENLPHTNILNVGKASLISVKDHSWNQEVFEKEFGIEIETVRIFVTNPNSIFGAHRDCITKSRQLREWAINVPLFNCDKGVNQWFDDTNNDFGKEIYVASAPALIPQNQNLNVSEECKLDCIKVFRTDVYHNVNNLDNDKHRVIVSYRPKTHILWTDIKRILGLND